MTQVKFITTLLFKKDHSKQNLQQTFPQRQKIQNMMKSQTTIFTQDQGDENGSFSQKDLFMSFKDSYREHMANPQMYNHVSKNFQNISSKQSSLNKQKAYKSQNYINIKSISPFCLQMSQKRSSLNQDQSQVQGCDRFIPTRKFIQRQSSLISQNQQVHNQNYLPPAIDPHYFTASQIYKKFIMGQNKASKDTLISIFENDNLLKFRQQRRTSILTQNPDVAERKMQFKFAQKLIKSTSEKRKINKLPFKVLDAPALQDDFYLNLIDWGNQNLLAVGLSSNVYLWNGDNSKVTKLCDLGLSDTVTSVGWSVKGSTFTLGTNNGQLHLWDLNKMKRTRVMGGHTDRIASIAWNNEIVCTGSRDKTILQRDPRSKNSFFSKLNNHKQQVCGLKWSPDGQQLCSGGNDNKLYIWNQRSNQPVLKYSDHVAAVKAVTWSPHQHGLLLSGGGTADKTIKFRNTLQGTTTKSIDTGSQVCNLIFSKTQNQFVSTHGFSLNQINVWKYPKMQKISTLTGHTFRVLYLAMSPDGSTIVTGAGDETLRFWKVFPGINDLNKPQKSLLNVQNINIR